MASPSSAEGVVRGSGVNLCSGIKDSADDEDEDEDEEEEDEEEVADGTLLFLPRDVGCARVLILFQIYWIRQRRQAETG